MSETQQAPRELKPAAKVGISIGIVLVGLLFAVIAVKSKKAPAKEAQAASAYPVEVVAVKGETRPIAIIGSGTVIPARQVVVGSEVAGRVVAVSSELVPGGRFRHGEPLLRIDARDYKLAAQMQSAQVAMARTELEVEKTRKALAEQEWKLMGEKSAPGALALRDPQLQAAQSAVVAAESGLERSQLAVTKAGLRAPFNAVVVTRQAEQGQVVAPGTPLATLAGTDTFWVQVAIAPDKVPLIAVPGLRGDTEGAKAVVRQQIGRDVVSRPARVVRLAGDLEAVGRMAKVIVEVDDPLSLENAELPPLLLNSFVEVEIEGRESAVAYEIPRAALREQSTIWLARDGKLTITPVDVLWRRRATVLVRGDFAGEQVVITSPLAAPINGTLIRQVAARASDSVAPEAAPAPMPTSAPAARLPAAPVPPVTGPPSKAGNPS